MNNATRNLGLILGALLLLTSPFSVSAETTGPQDQASCLSEAKEKYAKGRQDCKGKSWKEAMCLKDTAMDYKKAQAACGSLSKVKEEGQAEAKEKGLDQIKNIKKPW
jgi:hypothetical protein